MDGLKIGLELVEEKVSELEVRLIEIFGKKKKENRWGKSRASVAVDNIRPPDTCIIGIMKGERR